ncbi:MAG: agmatine deiminase family protein [Flavobacteriales bacterium]|nr:agmatine deiminase family protein [Flavobacteriales bacterium]
MKRFVLAILMLNFAFGQAQVITTPPVGSQIRAMAEWEEVQTLTIGWVSFPSILKQIVAAAREECNVIILSPDPTETENYLLATNAGGAAFSNLNGINIISCELNSIWMRDYAANPVYTNEVDSLILVDWLYNRPRPLDDASPSFVADALNLDLYETSEAPYDLLYTGGNYMSDGFGTAFASELILDENDGSGDFNIFYPDHTTPEIDAILEDFMGIHTYIKMPTLPYDGIHHIDMHMKIVDEETLLVGEYPNGVADGPQINANIDYILSNYVSKFGTPYHVVRIPMPDSQSGLYPDDGASYRTYTNAVFVNNTIIFPIYREEFDTTAFRIWGEVCPGYELVGIDCDDNNSNIISQSGAIHCITHTVGVEDPLLISHQPLPDTYDNLNSYEVVAYMNHRTGIASAKLFWKLSTETTFTEVDMVFSANNNWHALIPPQAVGSIINYYVQGTSVSGKTMNRPMPAPEGFWTFAILGEISGVNDINRTVINRIYPNPASAITCIELQSLKSEKISITLNDMTGRVVQKIFDGQSGTGISKYFIQANHIESGAYQVTIRGEHSFDSLPLIIQ